MPEKITDELVKGLKPPATGNAITWDDVLKGFGIRVTAAGVKSFVLNYRDGDGHLRRFTIGSYGRDQWSAKAARKRAGELKKGIALGDDPMGEKRAAREADSVNQLCDRYVEEWLPRKRPLPQQGDLSMIRAIIRPKLGKRKVASVSYAEIDNLHRSLEATPVHANRVVSLLSKMFSLAIKWQMRTDNPCRFVERFHEDRRERYLTGDERARLLTAMQEYAAKGAVHAQTVTALRLAMLSGCRIREALSATWDQFDMDARIWTKPSAHTKQKKIHRVPVSAPALQLLSEMRAEAETEWLFPNSTRTGPRRHYQHCWASIIKAANITNLRVHDLRHSFASEGVSAGLSLPVLGALLGHTQPATTARYAHLLDDPLREATEAIGRRVAGPGEKAADVRPLHRDGAA